MIAAIQMAQRKQLDARRRSSAASHFEEALPRQEFRSVHDRGSARVGEQKKDQNMSTASESVMGVTRYPESSAMAGRLHSHDERTARKPEPAEASFLDTILGRRGSLRPILSQVEAVAGTNTTVLIPGETGTGKEVIARAIHELSPAETEIL